MLVRTDVPSFPNTIEARSRHAALAWRLAGCVRARVGLILCLFVVVGVVFCGCSSPKYASFRSVPESPLVDRLGLTSKKGPKATSRTQQFVRVHDLLEEQEGGDPRQFLEAVQEVLDRQPSAESIYAAAELAFLEGKKVESHNAQLALDLYSASVLYAYQYLFDERFRPLRNPYDPQFRGACDLYNGALEAGLRIACGEQGLLPGKTYTVSTATGDWEITCSLRGGAWANEDFDHFEFVSDYQLKDLTNHYHTYGLGVPLIAVRRGYEGEPAASKYYPPALSFPVTALLRPNMAASPDRADAQTQRRGVLEIYDPVSVVDVAVDDRIVPLESDLSTPLAYFLSKSEMGSLATIGLLRPERLLAAGADQSELATGLYMVQPYEPGKIPVLLVHGLWSSPMTWMQMFNDLRASPEIRENYQFWFYLYPTAQPFWSSAAQLRGDLAEVRHALDPEHREPALDQMVLVGHSMGGLLSRLQTMESRDDFWKITSDAPIEQFRAEPEVRKELRASFFFRPNPSIRRVVTIGTPHRGSRFSNNTTQWFANRLIRLPKMLLASQRALFRENRDLIRDDTLLTAETSIDSLDPDSPFFPVMNAGRTAPWVKYHNIIGLVPDRGLLGKFAAGSDGVVTLDSATMDDVQSQITVTSEHSVIHAQSRAVLEVKRILLEHLRDRHGIATTAPFMRTSAAGDRLRQPSFVVPALPAVHESRPEFRQEIEPVAWQDGS